MRRRRDGVEPANVSGAAYTRPRPTTRHEPSLAHGLHFGAMRSSVLSARQTAPAWRISRCLSLPAGWSMRVAARPCGLTPDRACGAGPYPTFGIQFALVSHIRTQLHWPRVDLMRTSERELKSPRLAFPRLRHRARVHEGFVAGRARDATSLGRCPLLGGREALIGKAAPITWVSSFLTSRKGEL